VRRVRIDPVCEAVVLAGAGRAILLQLARSEVGQGVAEHSDFARNPMGRLHGTLMYVYAVMSGTEADAAVASGYVDRMHDRVHGEGYSAHDPELQLWVAATLYDTAVRVYERVLGHLPEREADELYRRYAALGTALRVPADLWPPDRRAFRDYWERRQELLHITPTARAQADALWAATEAPSWVRALMPLNRFVTAGLLPPAVREGFGLAWSERRRRRFERLFDTVAAVYPLLPGAVRTAPQRYYLRRLRRLAQR